MKAAVNTRYGPPDVVEVRDIPVPQPGPGEVLVRVHASTVSRSDCGLRRAHPWFTRLVTGLLRPKRTVLGMDFAGEVEEVGSGVASLSPGDRVFGIASGGHGGHAEYLCMSANGEIAAIPPGMRYAEVVVGEGALYANSNLQAFGIRPEHKVLVYGASGAIGTAAVQLAKIYGAHVTAVVGTRHVELAAVLGSDRVVDFTAEDFTKLEGAFDLVFDAVGKTTYFRCRPLLGSRGVFASTDMGPWGQTVLLQMWSAITRSGRVLIGLPKSSQAFVEWLRDRMEAGEFRAVIDREYPLEEIVDAYRYVETGQKTGIVVLNISHRTRMPHGVAALDQ